MKTKQTLPCSPPRPKQLEGPGSHVLRFYPAAASGAQGTPPEIHPLIPEERDGKAKALITEHKHRPFNMWKYF